MNRRDLLTAGGRGLALVALAPLVKACAPGGSNQSSQGLEDILIDTANEAGTAFARTPYEVTATRGAKVKLRITPDTISGRVAHFYTATSEDKSEGGVLARYETTTSQSQSGINQSNLAEGRVINMGHGVSLFDNDPISQDIVQDIRGWVNSAYITCVETTDPERLKMGQEIAVHLIAAPVLGGAEGVSHVIIDGFYGAARESAHLLGAENLGGILKVYEKGEGPYRELIIMPAVGSPTDISCQPYPGLINEDPRGGEVSIHHNFAQNGIEGWARAGRAETEITKEGVEAEIGSGYSALLFHPTNRMMGSAGFSYIAALGGRGTFQIDLSSAGLSSEESLVVLEIGSDGSYAYGGKGTGSIRGSGYLASEELRLLEIRCAGPGRDLELYIDSSLVGSVSGRSLENPDIGLLAFYYKGEGGVGKFSSVRVTTFEQQ